MRNAQLDEAQAGIKIARRTINSLRYADDTTFMAESEEELKSFLMKVKEQSEKAGLKLNIQKKKVMASSPSTSWQIDGKTMETVRFYFLGLQGWWLQPWYQKMLAHWRKAMTNLDSVLKSRDITLRTKVCIVNVMVLHVQMWKLDYKTAWVPKNWCLWTVVVEKTLESSLDSKKIKPVNPKGNQP